MWRSSIQTWVKGFHGHIFCMDHFEVSLKSLDHYPPDGWGEVLSGVFLIWCILHKRLHPFRMGSEAEARIYRPICAQHLRDAQKARCQLEEKLQVLPIEEEVRYLSLIPSKKPSEGATDVDSDQDWLGR